MKISKKLWISASVLTATLIAAQAEAVPVLNISAEGSAASSSAETAFIAGLATGSVVTENFDSMTPSTAPTTSISSPVGTFKQLAAGSGGLCETSGFGCGGLAILDDAANTSGPGYSGRFAISQHNWLDSNDSRLMEFDVATGYDSVGFYMTDPNDSGGNFTITTKDGIVTKDFGSIFATGESNGQEYYLSFRSNSDIQKIVINSNATGDGYGIDNVTIGVPEPGTIALMGLGLLGIGLVARRRTAA